MVGVGEKNHIFIVRSYAFINVLRLLFFQVKIYEQLTYFLFYESNFKCGLVCKKIRLKSRL